MVILSNKEVGSIHMDISCRSSDSMYLIANTSFLISFFLYSNPFKQLASIDRMSLHLYLPIRLLCTTRNYHEVYRYVDKLHVSPKVAAHGS